MPKLRRYAISAIATGLLVAAATHGLPRTAPLRTVTLPAAISPQDPVRVVSTTRDEHGRPVVTVRTATDRGAAAGLVEQGRHARHAVGVEIDLPTRVTGTDPFRGQQWDFAEMRVAAAWPASTGAGVTVAVLDSGVDATNPDLAGQVLPGADLVTGAGDAGADPLGHGTHVAGVIAALTGNDLGISSIAPDAKILPVRIVDANGNGFLSTAAAGVVYATDHGADVINMSIAARGSAIDMTDAIAYARSKGVVVIAAAGNDRGVGSPASYPAAEPGVIAVAATGADDAVAGYSTAGDYVDVAAPGTNILSTFPVAKGADFAISSGTSMAAPHVAAVAALLKARDRSLTPDRIAQAIESSAVDLGVPGRDDDYGYGRVDAAAALAALSPPAVPVPVPVSTTPSATVADLASADPVSADPASADPASADPATADPMNAGPSADGLTAAAPGTADPATTDPTTAGPASSAPTATPVAARTTPESDDSAESGESSLSGQGE
jgi:subtilisin family serine protease